MNKKEQLIEKRIKFLLPKPNAQTIHYFNDIEEIPEGNDKYGNKYIIYFDRSSLCFLKSLDDITILPEDNEGDVVEKKDRYYLVGPDGWIFSSDKKEECIDFKNNMIQSKRFAVGKIKSLIVVDIEDLGKYSSD